MAAGAEQRPTCPKCGEALVPKDIKSDLAVQRLRIENESLRARIEMHKALLKRMQEMEKKLEENK